MLIYLLLLDGQPNLYEAHKDVLLFQGENVFLMSNITRVFSEFRLYGIPYFFLNSVYSV